jgi:poly-gamma-glutamate synthesis protein (capsule biosynthesis protein)
VTYHSIALLLLLVAPSAAAQAPAERDSLRLVFVGDMNFARSLARQYLLADRGSEIFGPTGPELRSADIAVGNLESILLERGARTDTTNSPVFAGPRREAAAVLREAGFDVLGTANNHAWDFSESGLLESLGWLDSAELAHAGTGPNVDAAWRPVVIRTRGWTVAVFSLAGIINHPSLTVRGWAAECCIAWLDTVHAARRFRAVRDSVGADLIIASVHAGVVEYRGIPDPAVVLNFRGLIRAGADAVIGHHPHVPQGVEWVNGRPIVYSLGNFVFRQGSPWTDRGLWAELRYGPEGTPRLALRPVAAGYVPRFLGGEDSVRVLARVDSLSRLIPAVPRLPRPRPRRNLAQPAARSIPPATP